MKDLEKAVIYSMDSDPMYCDLGLEKFQGAEFSEPMYKRAFEKCRLLKSLGQVVDPVILAAEGVDLSSMEATSINLPHYIRYRMHYLAF